MMSLMPRRFSQGIFCFLIATTLFLVVVDEQVRASGSSSVTAGWVGIFVLYYGLRSSLYWPRWWSSGWMKHWRYWCSRFRALLVVDLLVITLLLTLTGGWVSPLYMFYLGWVVMLVDEASSLRYLFLTVLASGAFVGGCFLALHQPPSPLQVMLIAEHLLLLCIVSLGIGLTRAFILHLRSAWEAERRQWHLLRQTLFAQLAHELYTPLSAITTSAALLSAPGATLQIEQRQQLAQVIQRNCTRMDVLLDDLLTMWRKQQHQLEIVPVPFHCLPVAELVAQTLSPLLGARQQRLVIAAEQPDIGVLADPRRLEQVLVNLLANAQKYAPMGTAITLTIATHQQEVLFAVHDEGSGVSLEEQSYLFDFSYRGANCAASSRAAGIGLALTKALVVAEGGQIWVESISGRGTTFYFTLPYGGLE